MVDTDDYGDTECHDAIVTYMVIYLVWRYAVMKNHQDIHRIDQKGKSE